MSYYSKIKRHLNPIGEQESDFYIKATEDALWKYFNELKSKLTVLPIFTLNGTVIVGNVSYAITNVPGGKLSAPTIHKISYLNIKSALWSEIPENSFLNLFEIIGNNFAKTFTFVAGDPIVTGPIMPISLTTIHFRHFGELFIAHIKTIAQTLTPDIFHSLLSEYIEKAIKAIPIQTISMNGSWVAGGMFNGTVTVNFSDVKL